MSHLGPQTTTDYRCRECGTKTEFDETGEHCPSCGWGDDEDDEL